MELSSILEQLQFDTGVFPRQALLAAIAQEETAASLLETAEQVAQAGVLVDVRAYAAA